MDKPKTAPPTGHFAETIDGILEFSRQHDSPAAYHALCRSVAGNAARRLDLSQLARRWARLATRNLMALHRQRHPRPRASSGVSSHHAL